MIVKLFGKKVAKLPFGLLILGVARASGYLRDVTLAVVFGLSPVADLFVYAFRLQLSLRAVFANETVNSLFVPAYLSNKSSSDRADFFNQVFTAFLVLAIPLLTILLVLQPIFLSTFAPGFVLSNLVEKGSLIGFYALLSLLIVTISSLSISRLNAEKRFEQAFSIPLVYNVALALGIVLAGMATSEQTTIHILGLGFVTSAALQLVLSLYLSWQYGLKIGKLDFRGLSKIGVTFYLWVKQASAKALEPVPFLILFALATQFEGGATKLFLVERLILFIPSILGLYLASINTSKIGDLLRTNDIDGATRSARRTFKIGFVIAAVCVPFVWFFSTPVVALLFQYGAFDEQASKQIASLIKILAVALPFATGEYVLTQSLFALRLYRAPVVASVAAICLVLVAPILLPSLKGDIADIAVLLSAVYVTRVLVLFTGLQLCTKPILFLGSIKAFAYNKLNKGSSI